MFAKRFKKLQEQKGWTISETTKQIGVSNDTMSTYRRSPTPRFKHLPKIAKAFGVSIEFLVTGSDKKKAPLAVFYEFKKYYSFISDKEKERGKNFIKKNGG